MSQCQFLRIKPHYTLVAHDLNTVELRAGVWNPYSHTLVDEDRTGTLLKILQCLDGSHAVADIASQLNVARSQVESLLDHLQRLDVLTTTATSAFQYHVDMLNPILCQPAALSAWQTQLPLLLIGPAQLTQQVQQFLLPYAKEQSITVLAEDDPLVRDFTSSQEEWLYDDMHFAQRLSQYRCWENHFVVFMQFPPQPLHAMKFNRIAHHLALPWLYATIDGPYVFIGPQFMPPIGPCFDCFETRLMMNLRESASYQHYKNALAMGCVYTQPMMISPSLVGLLAAHVALETLNVVLTRSAFTRHKVLAIYLPTMEMIYHDLFRVAGCQTCGANMSRDEQQLYFDAT